MAAAKELAAGMIRLGCTGLLGKSGGMEQPKESPQKNKEPPSEASARSKHPLPGLQGSGSEGLGAQEPLHSGGLHFPDTPKSGSVSHSMSDTVCPGKHVSEIMPDFGQYVRYMIPDNIHIGQGVRTPYGFRTPRPRLVALEYTSSDMMSETMFRTIC